MKFIQEIQFKHPIECTFEEFSDWGAFLTLAKDFQQDDNLIIILSRKDQPSYNSNMTKYLRILIPTLKTQVIS